MTVKQPTPQAVSAALKRAGFVRAISVLRGGVSGFSVSKLGAGPEVEVRYSCVSMGTSNEHRLMHLVRYERALNNRGYATEIDAPVCRLIVTAKTYRQALAAEPLTVENPARPLDGDMRFAAGTDLSFQILAEVFRRGASESTRGLPPGTPVIVKEAGR